MRVVDGLSRSRSLCMCAFGPHTKYTFYQLENNVRCVQMFIFDGVPNIFFRGLKIKAKNADPSATISTVAPKVMLQ